MREDYLDPEYNQTLGNLERKKSKTIIISFWRQRDNSSDSRIWARFPKNIFTAKYFSDMVAENAGFLHRGNTN
jgi:hypothetical protein